MSKISSITSVAIEISHLDGVIQPAKNISFEDAINFILEMSGKNRKDIGVKGHCNNKVYFLSN